MTTKHVFIQLLLKKLQGFIVESTVKSSISLIINSIDLAAKRLNMLFFILEDFTDKTPTQEQAMILLLFFI